MRVTPELIEKMRALEKVNPNPRLSALYGIDKIVKRYLKLPNWFPLAHTSYIEHGISVRYDILPDKATNNNPEIFLLNNSHRKALLPKDKNGFTLGQTFLLQRRMQNYKLQEERKGTIAFPVHSAKLVNVETEWEAYAHQLLALPEAFQPVTVCMYYLDLFKGRHAIFEELGIKVVTNGHITDEKFADTFYENIVDKKFTTSNGVTSSMFFALDMKLPFFIYGIDKNTIYGDKDYTRKVKSHHFIKKLENVFSKTIDELKNGCETSLVQQEIANFIIDEKNWDDPSRIRKYLMTNFIGILMKKLFFQLFSK